MTLISEIEARLKQNISYHESRLLRAALIQFTASAAHIEELEGWKASALRSLADWHALGDALMGTHKLPLGVDIPTELTKRVRASTEKHGDLLMALKLAVRVIQTWQGDGMTPEEQRRQAWAMAEIKAIEAVITKAEAGR